MATSFNLDRAVFEKIRERENTGGVDREFLYRSQENIKLEFMFERLLKLEVKVEDQNEQIEEQKREINRLKIQKIIFENKLEILRDEFEKETSKLYKLVQAQNIEINHLRQQFQNISLKDQTEIDVDLTDPDTPIPPSVNL